MGGRGRWISEFEACLVYKVRSWTARATQRNPVSKKQNNNNKKIMNHRARFIRIICNGDVLLKRPRWHPQAIASENLIAAQAKARHL